MRRCSLVVASVLISVAALSGCGSDGENTDSGAESSTTSSDGSGQDDGDGAGSSESGGETPDDGEAPSEGDQGQDSGAEDEADERKKAGQGEKRSDGRGDQDDKAGEKASGNAAYCKAAKTLRRELNPSNEAAFVDADFQAISTRLGRIADSAPGGVASDWRKLSNGFGTLAKRFDSLGVDLDKPKTFTKLKPKQQKQLRSAITQVSSLQGSIKAAVASARKTCGISVG